MRPSPHPRPWSALALIATAALAGPPSDPVRLEVKTGDGNQSMMFVARNGAGDSHQVQLQSVDGKVVVDAEPDANRPWLGVLLDDSKSDADSDERSLQVLSVANDSPASRAGLQAGDVITGIDGTSLAKRGDDGLLGGHRPGDPVRLQVTRDGEPRDVRVTLSGHPGHVEFPKADGLDAFAFAGDSLHGLKGLEALESLKGLKCLPCPAGMKCPQSGFCFAFGGGPVLGVSVETMSDQLAHFFGAEPGHGILVKDVVDGSAAQRAGIEAGDVILRVGKTDVRSVGDVHEAIDDLKAGDRVNVEVLRHGARKTLTATIDEARKTGAMFRQPMPDSQDMARLSEQLAEAQAAAERSEVYGRAMPDSHEMELLAERLAKAEAEVRSGPTSKALAEAAEALAKAQAELERAVAEREAAEADESDSREVGTPADEDEATPRARRDASPRSSHGTLRDSPGPPRRMSAHEGSTNL